MDNPLVPIFEAGWAKQQVEGVVIIVGIAIVLGLILFVKVQRSHKSKK